MSPDVRKIFSSLEVSNGKVIMGKKTMLHQAATEGFVEAIQILTAQGAKVNARNEDGSTPLHLAADNGHYEAVETLLERGALIHIRDVKGRTPLQEAVFRGHTDIVQMLIAHGSNVNNQTNSNSANPGATALHEASGFGYDEIVAMLLARGANANLKTDGETPLHRAITYNRYSIASLLLRDTRDENIKEAYTQASNKAPWHIAMECGDWKRAKQFLSELEDVNQSDEYGTFPLILAIRKGQRDIVEYLLDRGAKVYTKGADDTPLGTAAYYDRKDIVKLLLKRGAPVNGSEITNNTPLNRAVDGRNSHIVKLLLKHGARPSWWSPCPLQDAAANGDTSSVKWLLEYGVDVNAANDFGTTPLHWAASEGQADTVQLLIKRGAKVNAKDEEGNTPLHHATSGAHKGTVMLLLKHGAKVNVRNQGGETPLTNVCAAPVQSHWVRSYERGATGVQPPPSDEYEQRHADGQHVCIAKKLLKSGAKVNVRVKESRAMPLHFAAFQGDKDLVALLLRYGAKINARDADGQTPVAVANCCDHAEVVELMVQHGAYNLNGRQLDSVKSEFDSAE